MNYCEECGGRLTMKECGTDGMIPYCNACQTFRFPMFNSAISAIIFNPDKTKILLIQQYGKKDNILVAGYISKGENAKQALLREIEEEVNLKISSYIYNDNEYFEKTNTLIHNYAVTAESEDFSLTDEVDRAQWFAVEEVLEAVKPDSLAKSFVERYLKKIGKGKTDERKTGQEEARKILEEAVHKLYEKDRYLILDRPETEEEGRHVAERSIVFRFGHYLQEILERSQILTDLSVDCEYNRRGYEPKMLSRIGSSVSPDLIVHHRGDHSNNFLVMEFKTWWNRDQKYDEAKIDGFMDPDGGYAYQYGIALCIEKEEKDTLRQIRENLLYRGKSFV